jgi:hypothetical protein
MENAASRLWSIPDWCADARLSRGWFYCQPPHLKPRHVKIGRSVRIIETPREYGERIAREQAEQQAAAWPARQMKRPGAWRRTGARGQDQAR